jgi:hypothetical protein
MPLPRLLLCSFYFRAPCSLRRCNFPASLPLAAGCSLIQVGLPLRRRSSQRRCWEDRVVRSDRRAEEVETRAADRLFAAPEFHSLTYEAPPGLM